MPRSSFTHTHTHTHTLAIPTRLRQEQLICLKSHCAQTRFIPLATQNVDLKPKPRRTTNVAKRTHAIRQPTGAAIPATVLNKWECFSAHDNSDCSSKTTNPLRSQTQPAAQTTVLMQRKQQPLKLKIHVLPLSQSCLRVPRTSDETHTTPPRTRYPSYVPTAWPACLHYKHHPTSPSQSHCQD